MRKFLLLLAVIIPIAISAQQIKIRKGNVLLDKTIKIGTFKEDFKATNTSGYSLYTMEDLKGSKLEVFVYKGEDGMTLPGYFHVQPNFSKEHVEVSLSELNQKGFVSYGVKFVRYLFASGLWTEKEGINKKEIIAKGRNLSGGIKAAAEAKAAEDAKRKANEDKIKAINPFAKRNGEIVKGGHEGTEVIGYVESPDHYLETAVDNIKIYDLKKNLIAKGKSGIFKEERFTTFDGVEHKYAIKKELNKILKPLFLSEAIYLLMLEGYVYEGGKVPYDPTKDLWKKEAENKK